MSRTIAEPDWKIFRQLHGVALERFCERVLAEITQLATASSKTNHERYLAVYQLMQKQDRELAEVFNDLRRSTALLQLARIQALELLTEEELARFSPETRAILAFFRGQE